MGAPERRRAGRSNRGAALERPEPTRIPAPSAARRQERRRRAPFPFPPSVYELLAAGWVPVEHDTRYGSTLCEIEEQPARQVADKDEAAAIVSGLGEASA